MPGEPSPSKLRLIVRRDLPVGLQAAQLVHGGILFNREHKDVADKWYEESNTVALLSVPDEKALRTLLARAVQRGLRTSTFVEPDLEDSLTCVVLEADEVEARRVTRGLPLMGA